MKFNKQKHYFNLFIFLLINFFINISYSEIKTKQDLSINIYNVSGDETKSFYNGDKTRFLYEGTVNYNTKLNSSGEFYGNMFYDITDDKLIDANNTTLKQLTLGYRDTKKEFIFGDRMNNFSDYSLNNSLKGLVASFKTTEQSNLIFVFGVDVPTWEMLLV